MTFKKKKRKERLFIIKHWNKINGIQINYI